MRIEKRVVATLPKVYSICKVYPESTGGMPTFLAGSETDGPLVYFEPPAYNPVVIADRPGGFISVWPFARGGRNYVVASTQFRPGFNAAACQIHALPLDAGPRPDPIKVFPFPYTHRVAVIDIAGVPTFLASTLCAKKESKDDWAHPGGVFAAPIPDPPSEPWEPVPVLENLNKNHGMDLARILPGGAQGLLISALEGCFFLTIPEKMDAPWPCQQIDSQETSDAFAFDWDGSGHPQIFSLQPFHGNRVHIYRRRAEAWQKSLLTDQIEFGHVLWAGSLLGRRALVVGWRRAERDLVVYWKTGEGEKDYEKEVIDRDIGPAQMAVHHDGDRELLVVSGHGVDSVLVYELTA